MKRIYFLLIIGLLSACQVKKTESLYVGHWVEIMPVNKQIVQGINLNADGTASSIGMETLKYEKWELNDKQITLTGKSIGNGQTIDFSDTLDIIEITPYTMTLGKLDKYRINYYRVEDVPDVNDMDNVPNLLQKSEAGGDLETRIYKGTLPAASNPGIVYEITLYNYKNNENGVFKAKLTYLEAEKGKDVVFEFAGLLYTLSGNTENKNATILQLIPFNNKEDTMNFLYQEKQLTLLDKDMKPIKSELNYTLKKVE